MTSSAHLEVGVSDESMASCVLPRRAMQVRVPPIKCQGIKTKLVPFIMSSIQWRGNGRWIEPFAGSAVVAINVAASRALLADSNVHLVRFYREISSGRLTPEKVATYLRQEGTLLADTNGAHYYEVRERFNANPSSLDFLFLNRSCFNGLIRFNSKGHFNVPFGKKPARFQKAYITKITNQVVRLKRLLEQSDWRFQNADWRDTLAAATKEDFVYADPPYLGRHTDYYNSWTETESKELISYLRDLPCGFALSAWKENKYRRNPHLPTHLPGVSILTAQHFYHLGATQDLRNQMEEALVVKSGFTA